MIEQSRRAGGPARYAVMAVAVSLALMFITSLLNADEPYARTRDYDLEHSKIALRFDLDERKVFGDVTHTLSILRDNISKIAFDSVGLDIQEVTVNKAPAKFETTCGKLIVPLPASAHPGQKFDIEIRYDGKPTKGLFFILPDKHYPDRPKQIWTQGESEDTRYYLPTYDYPNDRVTTETILTVPASFLTVSNGKLISVSDAGNGMKTWTWKESVPSSTYLITVVAGEFDQLKQSWRNIPVNYYAPKGRGDRLLINYERTPAMLDLFTKKIGVDYPWEKYAQVMVDDFVAGGMENSSATTNTSSSLRHPKLVPEFPGDEDDLISHELAHQWFGDLVTCKDWGNVWLNEGFATFFETLWSESHYPKELSEYSRWKTIRSWFDQTSLYTKPMVRFDFNDSSIFDQNSYDKGGLVLYMLRHQIGEDAFWRGIRRYLEVNRGKNVVTADLVRAIEDATHISVDRFFDQWVYGAGAPKFDLSYKYDEASHRVALTVKQTQKIESHVGLFHVPVEVEITTPFGRKLENITVSKDTETFSLPSDGSPLMVLFDKGGHILRSTEFHKEKKEWLYQLRDAEDFADRADAVMALGKIKNDDEVVIALGNGLNTDKAWGIRDLAADALGRIGGAAASKQLLEGLNVNEQPWVRNRIVAALGNFRDDANIAAKLESIARDDHSYRARASALEALGRLKSPNAFEVLSTAATGESPDGFLRNAALRSLGYLGDNKAVALLREWSAPGKPMDSRNAAIASLGRIDKDNKEITLQLASYLTEPHFPARMAAVYALGNRGDASAIPALETLLKSSDLSIEMVPTIKEQLGRLQKSQGTKRTSHGDTDSEAGDEKGDSSDPSAVSQRLDKIEYLVEQMNERLKSIEARLPPPKKPDHE
jgi:aminopeptidase N